MEKKSDEKSPQAPEPTANRRGNNSLLIALILTALVLMLFFNRAEERSLVSASFFQKQLDRGNVAEVQIGEQQVFGEFRTRPPMPSELGEEPEEAEEGEEQEAEAYLKEFAF